MASTGLIFRSNMDVGDLPSGWKPEPLGERAAVVKKLEALTGHPFSSPRVSLHPALWLELEIDDGPTPRSITVSGVFAEREMDMIQKICASFEARCYDSQECDYIV